MDGKYLPILYSKDTNGGKLTDFNVRHERSHNKSDADIISYNFWKYCENVLQQERLGATYLHCCSQYWDTLSSWSCQTQAEVCC